jgi:hypothetical protein
MESWRIFPVDRWIAIWPLTNTMLPTWMAWL